MDETKAAFHIIDQEGVRGTIDLTIVPPQGSESKLVLVRFDDGSQVFADAGTFIEREEREFLFPGSFAALLKQNPSARYGGAAFGEEGRIVVPLLEEQLHILRELVLTGGIRVHKTVRETVETIDEPILREEVSVEHVPVNRFIDQPPPVRYEGEVMIVPLLEEVLVVEKKLVLREEIRITKRSVTLRNPQQYIVRREEAALEEIKPDAKGASLRNSQIAVDKKRGGE